MTTLKPISGEQHLQLSATFRSRLGKWTSSRWFASPRERTSIPPFVPEDMALKLSIFVRLDTICPPPAVLASSSGHPASELVERVRHRERVIAAHFWYPPQLLPLVEVCGGPETSAEVITWTCAALREAGKEPVVIDREVPGFIGNRIQFAQSLP